MCPMNQAEADVEVAMTNNSGFGGHNASFIFTDILPLFIKIHQDKVWAKRGSMHPFSMWIFAC